MKKRWQCVSKKTETNLALHQESTIPLPVLSLLSNIGIESKEDVERFLKPKITHIHNPFSLLDMNKAVARIKEAIEKSERILIFGDYDCDGVTTIAFYKRAFQIIGVEVDTFAPNRFQDGYGLNLERIKTFTDNYDLIISGDTGIRAFDAANYLSGTSCDLIVTDHHEPMEGTFDELMAHFIEKIWQRETGLTLEHRPYTVEELSVISTRVQNTAHRSKKRATDLMQQQHFLPITADIHHLHDRYIALPKAVAVIDQQRTGDAYPFKNLAGVGVAFKTMQALYMTLGVEFKKLLYLTDYVAVGTIADLAKQIDAREDAMDFENRALCKMGIAVMNKAPKAWVKGIALAAGLKKEESGDMPFFKEGEGIDSTSIGFRIGPLLNAPGRMDDPSPSVDLLLEEDLLEAIAKAKVLKEVNTKRQEDTTVYKRFVEQLMKEPKEKSDFGVVVTAKSEDEFHIGIAGLIAEKVKSHYYRPAIALSPVLKNDKMVLKGSARSIPGVNVLHCLDEVRQAIGPYEYGGHAPAAGMTLEPERLPAFQKAFREACKKHDKEVFTPICRYDSVLSFHDISYSLMDYLEMLEPYGEGMFSSSSKKPLFRSNNVMVSSFTSIMEEGKGCYFIMHQQTGPRLKGITFTEGVAFVEMFKANRPIDLLYSLAYNVYNGNKTIQLFVEDIRLS